MVLHIVNEYIDWVDDRVPEWFNYCLRTTNAKHLVASWLNIAWTRNLKECGIICIIQTWFKWKKTASYHSCTNIEGLPCCRVHGIDPRWWELIKFNKICPNFWILEILVLGFFFQKWNNKCMLFHLWMKPKNWCKFLSNVQMFPSI